MLVVNLELYIITETKYVTYRTLIVGAETVSQLTYCTRELQVYVYLELGAFNNLLTVPHQENKL